MEIRLNISILNVQGETMPSKKEARQAAAFEACMMLHQLDALDDHLLPVESSSESEESDGDEVDGRSQPKTGTKKRRRSHPVKVQYNSLRMCWFNVGNIFELWYFQST